MNILSKYINYLRANPEGYWFKCKIWGWGWVPARWEGWATLAAFIAALVLRVVPYIKSSPHTPSQITGFIVEVIIWVALLFLVCYLKGEPPRWHWGFPEEKK